MKSKSLLVFGFTTAAVLLAHHGVPVAHDYPELTEEQLELCKHGNFHPSCEQENHGIK